MKPVPRLAVVCIAIATALDAGAQLKNVTVGGKIEIFGGWNSNFWEPNPDGALRIPSDLLPLRPIGPDGTLSFLRTDGEGSEFSYVQQRTRLGVFAEFEQSVNAFIEIDSVTTWGDDFRSNPVTGLDFRVDTSTEGVDIFQAYIEMNELFGQDLTVRIGRQEIVLGSGWLVGADYGYDPWVGFSFDAVRATYTHDRFSLDAWYSKLAERDFDVSGGDTDFYGVYGTVNLADEISLDLYWMQVRDARDIDETQLDFVGEWIEDRAGLDDYGVTRINTIGARTAGVRGRFDWEAEAAYQFGPADALGSLFVPFGRPYGDNEARYGTWAARAEAGVTVEERFGTRLALGGAFYGGEDQRDLSWDEWLVPWRRPDASVSFNRMFSEIQEDWFLDASAYSNFWTAYLGYSLAPTESIEIAGEIIKLGVVAPFDSPHRWDLPGGPVYPFARFPLLTKRGSTDLGWQFANSVTYAYSEDLSFEFGYVFYLIGQALDDGAFLEGNGTNFSGGLGDDNAHYVYGVVTLEF